MLKILTELLLVLLFVDLLSPVTRQKMSARESSRRIHVSVMPNADGIQIDIPADRKLSKRTLQSQFERAIGLKYLSFGQWVAVTMDEDNNFLIPDQEENVVVVTDTVDRARSILSNSTLATQVASVFGSSGRPRFNMETSFPTSGPVTISSSRHLAADYTSSSLKQNMSRKQSRMLFSKKAKLPKDKVFKVVFVHKVELPTGFSKELVISEGFITVKSDDLENDIIDNLRLMLRNSNITCDKLVILTYSSKTLAIPCLAPEFLWSLETIRKNVGQGKLYVMVNDKIPVSSDSDDHEDLPSMDRLRRDRHSAAETLHTLAQVTNATETPPMDTLTQVTSATETPHKGQAKCAEESAGDMYTDADTPTVQLRTRRNLSLRRTTTEDPGRNRPQVIATRSQYEEIEVLDSEDEELEQAIEASLHDLQSSTSTEDRPSEKDIKVILNGFYTRVINEGMRTEITVRRRHVLESAFTAFRRPTCKLYAPLYVKFSGEIGEDMGGPRREIFRLSSDPFPKNGKKVQELLEGQHARLFECLSKELSHLSGNVSVQRGHNFNKL